jgi:ribosome-associated protein
MDPLWSRIANALMYKKARDLIALDVRDLSPITDYIIICTGTSDRQIKAMAEHVIEVIGKPFGKEGVDEGRWVLLDYLDAIVHIFQDDLRRYYDLEGMWLEAKRLKV